MIGKNTLTLNQETVKAAVQAYLDKHIVPNVQVTELKPNASYEPYTYTVSIEEIVEDGKSAGQ